MLTDRQVYDIFRTEIRPAIIEMYGEDDSIAIRETFNNWTDALCKDGEITEQQYNDLCWEED